jgi:hypothetical protein
MPQQEGISTQSYHWQYTEVGNKSSASIDTPSETVICTHLIVAVDVLSVRKVLPVPKIKRPLNNIIYFHIFYFSENISHHHYKHKPVNAL